MDRFAVFLLTLTWCFAANADIYHYVDDQGALHFARKPLHDGYTRVLRAGSSASTPTTVRLPTASTGRRAGGTLPYSTYIADIAAMYGLDPLLVHSVIAVESAYDELAVSVKGAVGLMQLMPETAQRYYVRDVADPYQNIHGGVQYLADLWALFDGELKLVLAAYNAGEHAVIRFNYQIPAYPETQGYVTRVLDTYHALTNEV